MQNELLQLIGVGASLMVISFGHLLYFAHMEATYRTAQWYRWKTAASVSLAISALLAIGASVALCIDRFAVYVGAGLAGFLM